MIFRSLATAEHQEVMSAQAATWRIIGLLPSAFCALESREVEAIVGSRVLVFYYPSVSVNSEVLSRDCDD